MKKFITLFLALSLMCVLSVAAFAGSDKLVFDGDSAQADVTISYVDGEGKVVVRSIEVEWTDMTFTYTVGGRVWDAENNKYVSDAASWSNDGKASITVTNRSNIAIDVDVVYTSEENSIGVSASVKGGDFTLPSAEGKTVGDASLVSVATLELSDDVPAVTESVEAVKIGTVTVTVADAE